MWTGRGDPSLLAVMRRLAPKVSPWKRGGFQRPAQAENGSRNAMSWS